MSLLAGEKYLSLATFRKNGKAVETPVWFTHDADDERKLYVFTAGNSGKVKRLRNFSRSRVAACDLRGRVHGDWLDAETLIVDQPETIRKILGLMRRKYWLSMPLADLGARLTGRFHRRAYLEITLAS